MTGLRLPARTARAIRRAVPVACALLGILGAGAAEAQVQGPWWRISSNAAPTFLRPGDSEDLVFASASNIGDGDAPGGKQTITITDKLPDGLTPTSIKLISSAAGEEGVCDPLPALRCTFSDDVSPYVRIEARITVKVASDLSPGELANVVEVEGGETPRATRTQLLKIADQPTPFGVQSVELTPEDESGGPEGQAGSHPFQLTTTLDLNQTLEAGGRGFEPAAPQLLKNLHFNLPPGLVGNPQATPKCSDLDFSTVADADTNLCPAESVVGAALVTLNEPVNFAYSTVAVPVFNLTPAPGEPARFGFEAFRVPVVFDTAVRTGGDYSVQVNISNATSVAQVLGSQVTFWGEPGDPRHDASRGWSCVAGGKSGPAGGVCEPPVPRPTTPFLRLPTFCGGPLSTTLTGDSWSGGTLEGSSSIPALTGCEALPFEPTIDVQAEERAADTPTGLVVSVKAPQNGLLEAKKLAEADVRSTTVTLPEGVEVSPSAANGLQACSMGQVGFTGRDAETNALDFTPDPASCPDASKLGLVRIRTPLLPNDVEGSVYLAAQDANPFGSLIALYIVARDPVSGVLVKLAGEGRLNEQTGQITTTFQSTPQVPFEELKLQLFGGPRASVSTPSLCSGAYVTKAEFTPWSQDIVTDSSSDPAGFTINSGAESAPCANPQPFAPGFDAESQIVQAAAFTPFNLTITHPDADQPLQSVTVHLPPGVAAILANVTPCAEPPAQQEWACGPDSLVGHSSASSGLGPAPVSLPGRVYLTVGYNGAPFGLLVVTPAVAGPFNLGNVDIRSRINVDPNTAAVTITSDPFPAFVKGVPSQIKQINVSVDRPGFQFNPTSCAPMHITGTLTGAGGGSEAVSSPFQVTGCQSLPFAPKLAASAGGHGTRIDGTGFTVRVKSAGLGQSNIAKVRLQLPAAAPGAPHDDPESVHRREPSTRIPPTAAPNR